FFFHNQGNGKFVQKGAEVNVARAKGQVRGAMGIDWGEIRPDEFALIIGNFSNEPNTLFCKEKNQLFFTDQSNVEGIEGPSLLWLKFGLFFFDYDLDGRLDLLTCNGHLEPKIHILFPNQKHKQPAQLFWNSGKQPCFDEVTKEHVGSELFMPIVGRGCAYGSFRGDGSLDVVLTQNGGPAQLFRNVNKTGNHWIRLTLVGDGKNSNTSAIGAKVMLKAGGIEQRREATGPPGYLSHH